MRVRDLNWMQLEAYLGGDDRIVLPVGSTEQHAYLSLETDNILAERASVEAAEPLGVPVLPVLPYGVTGFTQIIPPRARSASWTRPLDQCALCSTETKSRSLSHAPCSRFSETDPLGARRIED